jgi:two-component system response regulator PilR (NtrC family)
MSETKTANAKILVVDDEPDIRELLAITLRRMKLDVTAVGSVAEARQQLQKTVFQLCLTDMRLPDGTGLELIEFIQSAQRKLPVAMITAYGNLELAIDALKLGAFDFLTKPLDIERLRGLVATALRLEEIGEATYDGSLKLLGNSQAMRQLREQIQKVSRSQAPVYISGESGSGKEVVARLIHASGPRGSSPFVPVNCGAIPLELMESEFFGHVKGSFTGAYDHKKGLFEAAQGGTLFLDEVADLPLVMQVKLLRAIQEKSVRKVGSNEEIPIDVRILSATHKELAAEVEAGRFRNDLFYRINVIEMKVPPLRERRDDVSMLIDYLLEKLASNWGIAKPVMDEEASQVLKEYAFPGNVRELENILERAVTLCENNTIVASDLQLQPTAGDLRIAVQVNDASNEDPSAAFGRLDDYLADIEKRILLAALDKCRWNRSAAAELLGISFRQMRYRLAKLNIEE